jgi:hypothetical protein
MYSELIKVKNFKFFQSLHNLKNIPYIRKYFMINRFNAVIVINLTITNIEE